MKSKEPYGTIYITARRRHSEARLLRRSWRHSPEEPLRLGGLWAWHLKRP